MNDTDLTKLRRARSRAHFALKQGETLAQGYRDKLADLEARIQAIAPDCGFRRSRPGKPSFIRAPFRSDAAHHSNLMAPRMVSSRRSILVMSWGCGLGQAGVRGLRRLSPLSSMRCALCMIRSRMASASVGLPTISYQRSVGTWLVIISEPAL